MIKATSWLSRTFDQIKPGDRLRLAVKIERFPFFVVGEGATGTVTEAGSVLAVRMDDPIAGCEEWGNEILLSAEDYGVYTDPDGQSVTYEFVHHVDYHRASPGDIAEDAWLGAVQAVQAATGSGAGDLASHMLERLEAEFIRTVKAYAQAELADRLFGGVRPKATA